MLSKLIKTNALIDAQAGNWDAVAAILNTSFQIPRETKAYYTEVYQTLGDADMRHTLRVMAADEIGQAGVARLNDASVDGGMYFAHPITVGLIEALRDKLNPGVADKLLRLGVIETTLSKGVGFDSVSSEECSKAYLSDANVLMSVNRSSDDVTRVMVNLTRDGQSLKVAMLTEQQGTPADIALIVSIEAAIDTWIGAQG